jgi:hypothetical protein
MKHIFLLVIALTITACATKPVTYEQAKNVDMSRIYMTDIIEQQDDRVKVVVKRDTGFTGSGCYLGLIINGDVIADLDTGEKIDLYLKPNDYIFAVKSSGKLLCESSIADETEVIVQKNVFKQYRIGTNHNMGFFIRRTSF